MIRKIILLLLSLGFFAAGAVFALGELNLAAKTGDQDHVYAALFGGGLFTFVGLMLLFLVFRKRKPANPEAAAATVWAVGMTTAMDDGGDDFSD